MVKIASYGFAEGSRFQKGANTSAPELVGEHLETIRKAKDGKLTPDDVVADARNPNSPLHSFFEWDDSAAAHEHRLRQARQLIRTVVVRYQEVESKEPIRAYVNVRSPISDNRNEPDSDEPRQYYTDTVEALSAPDMRRAVLLRAKSELDAWRKRYADLEELSIVVRTITKMSEKVGELADA
ncbi:hypothetical protein DEA98_10040 [Brucella pseudogrignonensis]|uniref:Uncharacterized protein n=1 Tax=Brucella pseudogrignonensis TaxID=419475 RepID=A0A7Y3T795_9HYPH|nr:hypothetical protein [Brucella pseudogrignonensis]MCM0751538.1 hypothetical protein [Brucella pseudogrignonensis]NNV22066.1 hypothetical protein [Brucella pseudogrignonensis]